MAKSPGRTAPGRQATMRSPGTKLCAPQMMPRLGTSGPGCGSFGSSRASLCWGPTSTRHQLMVLPFACSSLTRSSTRPPTRGPVTAGPKKSSSSSPAPAYSAARAGGSVSAGISTKSASQFSETRISSLHSETGREAHIAFDHVVHIVDSLAQHQGALDAHAEREALVDLGVDAGGAQHIGVDHAAAAPFDPAGAADLVGEHEVHLRARFGEREEARAQAGLRLGPEHLTGEAV